MRVLDLFSGLESVANVARARGHEVITLDFEPKFGADLQLDILNFNPIAHLPAGWVPDMVWASPPCEAFSVAALGHHWTGGKKAYIPATEWAKTSILIVAKTVALLEAWGDQGAVWFMENPVGVMRKLPSVQHLRRYTVTYCQYGDNRRKRTDIWTNSRHWLPRPMCSNGDRCHEAAPSGSRTGTQGMKNSAERAKIPTDLIETIFRSVEEADDTKGQQELL